ncbi:hypothetical protein AB6E45_004828, partial [Salmonella enterica]
PGAVTVTTPAQDAAGNVAATLTYVDTSGKLLSKEARAGTTTIAIGKAVKQTVDTRFYPQVHVCVSNLSASGYIVPGQTEVQICDGSGHAVPNGSGYTVTLPGMSSAGCTKSGGGVCPPDTAGKKADFTGLTGDDIANMLFNKPNYAIADTWTKVTMQAGGPGGIIVFYGELSKHFPYSPLGGQYGNDIFHTREAESFCNRAHSKVTRYRTPTFVDGLSSGGAAGGPASSEPEMKGLYIGRILSNITTGGQSSNPELFVSGGGHATTPVTVHQVYAGTETDYYGTTGAWLPRMLVMVNGYFNLASSWSFDADGPDYDHYDGKDYGSVSIGRAIAKRSNASGVPVDDMYYVNEKPGAPLTQHKPSDTDQPNEYVTQVNYVTGYVCEASFQ